MESNQKFEEIISDELLILLKSSHPRVTKSQAKAALSIYGEVDCKTQVYSHNTHSIVVKFKNKQHLLKTLETYGKEWIYCCIGGFVCIPPLCEISEDDDSPIKKISNCSLYHIFSFLSIRERFVAERVCKRWRDLSRSGWPEIKGLDLHKGYLKTLNTEQIFLRCGRFLKALILQVKDENLKDVHFAEQHCGGLEHLIIKFDDSESDLVMPKYYPNLSSLLQHCQKLISLEIHNINSNFIHQYLEWIPATLERLCLFGTDLDDELYSGDMQLDLAKFTTLTCLVLNNFNIPADDIIGFERLTELKRLDLWKSNLPLLYKDSIPTFQKLEELTLGIEPSFSDADISSITRNCPNLVYFDISGFEELTDACFSYIGKLPKLRYLYMVTLRMITSAALSHISNLILLRCHGCSNIGHEGLIGVIQRSPELSTIYCSETNITADFIKDANAIVNTRINGVALEIGLGEEEMEWKYHFDFSPLLTVSWELGD